MERGWTQKLSVGSQDLQKELGGYKSVCSNKEQCHDSNAMLKNSWSDLICVKIPSLAMKKSWCKYLKEKDKLKKISSFSKKL